MRKNSPLWEIRFVSTLFIDNFIIWGGLYEEENEGFFVTVNTGCDYANFGYGGAIL